jgi:probable H4MPT-linked C1 transfer pathway protein
MRVDDRIIGWDVGGAHLKAACVEAGRVVDAAQWPCELWRGLPRLAQAFADASARWPCVLDARHVVTMTGEMADLFEDREAGVAAIVAHANAHLGDRVTFYAGARSFLDADTARRQWRHVASANWRATATVVAKTHADAIVVDVGSTTADLVPIVRGRIASRGPDDAARLAADELVYVGVVRTPLCALAARIAFAGREYNVMNELFATTADVFRLTGELRPEHDQAAAADNGGKDAASTIRRLSRMIGHDARDASEQAWRSFAREWRGALVRRVRESMDRMTVAVDLSPDAVVVGAGCGSFIAEELAATVGRRYAPFDGIANADPDCADWVRACAPCAAVAMLAAGVPPCGS